MSSPVPASSQTSFYQHDDPELLDWLDDMEKSTYYECYDSTTFSFYFFNEETGDETTEEPDESMYHIVRYTAAEPSPPWTPEEQDTPDATAQDPLQEEFFVLPAIASREPSITSVASLIELPSGVELRTPYQALLSHLCGTEVALDGWKGMPKEDNDEQQEPGRASRTVSIVNGEIPSQQRSNVVDLSPVPRRRKKLKWGLLGGLVAVASVLLLHR